MSEADTAPVELGRAELATELPARRSEFLTVLAWRAAIVVICLAVWEFASGRLIKPFWISSPSEIWRQLMEWVATGQLWLHVEVTLSETLMGFGFGAISGVAVGLALGLNRRLAAVLDPFIVAFYSLPKIALAPLFILWFGVGLTSKVVLATFVVFFLVFYNTYAGTLAVEAELIDVLRLMGARRGQISLAQPRPRASPGCRREWGSGACTRRTPAGRLLGAPVGARRRRGRPGSRAAADRCSPREW